MKKAFSLCLFALLLGSTALAQNFHLGVKLGTNYSTQILKDFQGTESKYRAAFVGGAFVRIGINKFMIQPELLFSTHSAEISSNSLGVPSTENVNFNNVEIPILAGFKIIDLEAFHLRLMAGPVATLKVSASDNIKDSAKGAVWGYAAGVGADIWKITLDLRYQSSFTNSFEIAGVGVTPSGRPSIIQFTAGFKII